MKATYLRVEAYIRYWEDATVDGEPDQSGTRIPFRVHSAWCPRIRLSDGVVMDWPPGMEASIHYKVCDEGQYWLQDAEGKDIAKYRDDYVPTAFLCHGDQGWGDYIIFDIGPDGKIVGYEVPDIDPADWEGQLNAEGGT